MASLASLKPREKGTPLDKNALAGRPWFREETALVVSVRKFKLAESANEEIKKRRAVKEKKKEAVKRKVS